MIFKNKGVSVNLIIDDQHKAMMQFLSVNQNFHDTNFYFFRDYPYLSSFEGMTFNEAVCHILGISPKKGNKALKKAFYTSLNTLTHSNTSYSPYVDFLLTSMFSDHNYLIPLIKLPFEQKKRLIDLPLASEEQITQLWFFLKNRLSKKALFTLILDFYSQENMHDIYKNIVSLYCQYQLLLEEKFITCKASMNDLLRIFTFLIQNHYVQKITYYYQAHAVMQEMVIGDLEFRLPCNSHELCLWAQILQNCLLTYMEKIPQYSIVYGVFKKGHLLYAVEIYKNRMIQMSGIQNMEIPPMDAKSIYQWIDQGYSNSLYLT